MMFAPITRTFEKSYADVDYDQGIPTPNQYIRNKNYFTKFIRRKSFLSF